MKRLTKRNESNTAYYYPHCFREDTCMGMGYSTKCDQCDFIDEVCEKLGEYEDAEEQGLILRLPCKVGDTVYELQEVRKRIQPMEIISVNIGRMGLLYFNWELKDGIGIYHNIKGFGASHIGKTVFLTKEEAEQALKQMGE